MKAEKRVMRYGSVCSGIEAATAAWHGLGWQPSFFSEIEAFPRAVLAHHYPDVPLHGDFTTIPENEYEPIDLLVGGTPCQSFSVAGLRGGLDDDRGNLALEFCRLAQRLRPRWIVWENVPGVLSSGGGRDFGSILGALEELGYGFAYRVLDAQYFGVAQRRRRVFVVGYLGDWRPAAAVLFERHSLSGHPAPSRETGQEAAGTAATGVGDSGGHVIAFSSNMSVPDCRTDGATPTLKLGGHGGGNPPAVAYDMRGREGGAQFEGPHDTANIRAASGGSSRSYVAASAVRRLTPVECERLQGFPDNFTAIPWRKKGAEDCPDGPRYKALGNSMAVPVMRWIGERIAQVDEIKAKGDAA
jgi:DNA (cytosine-5)-methyltransferase 1